MEWAWGIVPPGLVSRQNHEPEREGEPKKFQSESLKEPEKKGNKK